MPNCFALSRKGESNYSTLNEIDSELCQNLDLPWSPRVYTCGWYDDIGFALACGKTLPELVDIIRDHAHKPNNKYRTHELIMWRVAAYLNEHFDAHCWAERY